MFHLPHLIFFPFFVLFHIVGLIFLFFAAAVLVKAFRRRRAARNCAPGGRGLTKASNLRRSGNDAFDDYRRATLRKLELEADEFRKYLDGLRRAADATAFNAFLKSKRSEIGPAT